MSKPIYAGLDVSRVTGHTPAALSWEYLDRLRQIVSVKLLVKGILTAEDAELCMLQTIMRQAGTPTIAAITRDHVIERGAAFLAPR